MDYQIICHQHLFEPESQFAQCHASTIEMLPDGALTAAWFAGSHEKAPAIKKDSFLNRIPRLNVFS